MRYLFWVGRAVFWILGALFGFKLCGWLGSTDLITFFLLGMLCGDTCTLVFTLASTYVWLRFTVRAEISDDDIARSDWEEALNEVKGVWLGINLNLLPEYLGGLIGICAGLIVHVIFGLRWFGTLSVAFLVGILAEVVLGFALPILILSIAAKMERKSSGGRL